MSEEETAKVVAPPASPSTPSRIPPPTVSSKSPVSKESPGETRRVAKAEALAAEALRASKEAKEAAERLAKARASARAASARSLAAMNSARSSNIPSLTTSRLDKTTTTSGSEAEAADKPKLSSVTASSATAAAAAAASAAAEKAERLVGSTLSIEPKKPKREGPAPERRDANKSSATAPTLSAPPTIESAPTDEVEDSLSTTLIKTPASDKAPHPPRIDEEQETETPELASKPELNPAKKHVELETGVTKDTPPIDPPEDMTKVEESGFEDDYDMDHPSILRDTSERESGVFGSNNKPLVDGAGLTNSVHDSIAEGDEDDEDDEEDEEAKPETSKTLENLAEKSLEGEPKNSDQNEADEDVKEGGFEDHYDMNHSKVRDDPTNRASGVYEAPLVKDTKYALVEDEEKETPEKEDIKFEDNYDMDHPKVKRDDSERASGVYGGPANIPTSVIDAEGEADESAATEDTTEAAPASPTPAAAGAAAAAEASKDPPEDETATTEDMEKDAVGKEERKLPDNAVLPSPDASAKEVETDKEVEAPSSVAKGEEEAGELDKAKDGVAKEEGTLAKEEPEGKDSTLQEVSLKEDEGPTDLTAVEEEKKTEEKKSTTTINDRGALGEEMNNDAVSPPTSPTAVEVPASDDLKAEAQIQAEATQATCGCIMC